MPINRATLIRISTIDKCLQNHYRRWTINDLIDACTDALAEFEGRSNPVSRRTFQNDLALMRSDRLGYNAPIVVRENKYYEYEDPDFSITHLPLNDEGLDALNSALDILRQLQGFPQLASSIDTISKLNDPECTAWCRSIQEIRSRLYHRNWWWFFYGHRESNRYHHRKSGI